MMTKFMLLLSGMVMSLLASGQHTKLTFGEPVRLSAYASGVAIEWSTVQESDIDYYAIMRSTPLHTNVVARLQPRGNASGGQKYRYIDQGSQEAELEFSVRAVFRDGSYADSEPLAADVVYGRRSRILSALDSESLASLRISLDPDMDKEIMVSVKTLNGDVIDTYYKMLAEGVHQIEVDYANWTAGYYSVLLDSSNASAEWLVHVDPEVPSATTRRIRS